jgi:[ribosomal protein S18]-alanine N-acetyltransferase
MTWMLRRAGIDDLDAIMAIETATFASDAWSAELMHAELANEHTYYLVATDAAVEGYAGLLAPVGAGQADIQTIAVVESARGQGLGRTLMNALLSEARTRGADEVFLEVRADNPGAQHLYESLGFEQIDLRKKYYQPDGVDAVIMRLRMPAPRVVTT